ncbi:hypothetical protein D3C85_274480 [compost metagenome]
MTSEELTILNRKAKERLSVFALNAYIKHRDHCLRTMSTSMARKSIMDCIDRLEAKEYRLEMSNTGVVPIN